MQFSPQVATRFHRIVYGVAAAAVVYASCDMASAQRRQRRSKIVRLEPYNVEGTVLGVRPGWIQCVAADGTPHLIRLDEDFTERIVVTGTAQPEFVRPGMYVRFTTLLDDNGHALEPIEELTLVAPREGLLPGVFRDDRTDPDGSYLVMGQIRSITEGRVVLAAANDKVEFEVTESPQIEVDLADYSLARRGDSIRVRGGYERDPRELWGQRIEIELSQPLGFTADAKEPEQSTPRPRRSSRRGRRTAQEEGEPQL